MDSVEEIIDRGAVTPVYQPLVDLRSGLVVGYEALARGPEGSKLQRPDLLFAAARAEGRLAELDWLCRTAAVRGALGGRLRPPLTLFINSEPETIGSRMPAAFAEWWARARLASLQIMFEITERSVMERPAEILKTTDLIREFGWGVALDDVGTNPESMALLPFLRPDVIKLDMSLVQGTATDIGEIVFALNAEAERTGTVLLAEGIETGPHYELAKTFGATIGQGWFLGRPAALPDPLPMSGAPIAVTPREPTRGLTATPYEIVTEKVRPRRVTKEHLLGASRLIERRAAAMPHPPLMVATFQHADRFSGASRATYEDLSAKLPFIAVFAEGWDEERETTRPRRVSLDPSDSLVEVWTVGIISPFSAMLLSARERDEGVGELSFDVAMTFDRDLAIEAADCLLHRLVGPLVDEEATHEEVEFVEGVTLALAAAERETDMARPLLEAMSRIVGLESTFLSRIHEEDRYDVVVSYNNGSLDVAEGYSMPWTETICHDALKSERQYFTDVQAELPANGVGAEFGFRTYVTCPVIRDGRVVGTLCGASSRVMPLSEEQIDTVRRFAHLVARRLIEAETEFG